jgi:FKBP-type peptidyl-prolyl cis-trans isomerase FkpA
MRPVRWILSGLFLALFASAGIAATAVGGAAPPPPTTAKPAAAAASTPPAAPTTMSDSNLHALGVLLGGQLTPFQLSESEFKKVLAGLSDGFHHPELLQAAEGQGHDIQNLERARFMAAGDKEKKIGKAYLDKAAALPNATKTATGLVYIPLTPGTGATPTATDQVKVNYTGKLIDGLVFDASAAHGGAATFPLSGVVPCWTQALQLMKVGGKSRVVCPSELAYGDRGHPPLILPGSTLDFEIELLDVLPRAPAPTMPRAMPPAPPTSSGAPTPPHP